MLTTVKVSVLHCRKQTYRTVLYEMLYEAETLEMGLWFDSGVNWRNASFSCSFLLFRCFLSQTQDGIFF